MIMPRDKDIADRIEREGPIDLFISEEEYDYLKKRFRSIWGSSDWGEKDRRLTLAFLRGYTFYRDLSENDYAFWINFNEELGLWGEPVPTPIQYDNLWSAFERDGRLDLYLQWDGRGRAFVATIDEIWGFRSLRARELIDFFTSYYREHPGKRLTQELMQDILPSADDVKLRQAASYHRIFTSMTHAIDCVLEHELENLPVDELEATLVSHGVGLGQPNALRYFMNKSSQAISQIVGRLRLQRTPEQFRRFLRSSPHPNLIFLTPSGLFKPARNLAQDNNLRYGRYIEYTEEGNRKEHHVTPDARISLNIIDRLPVNVFKHVAGLEFYVSPSPFRVRVGSEIKASRPICLRRGLHYIWSGRLQQGVILSVGEAHHPETIGWSAKTSTRLEWNGGIPSLVGELHLNIFEPDRAESLTLSVGEEHFTVSPVVQDYRQTFEIDRQGVTVTLDDLAVWKWEWSERLFTARGREITEQHLSYGPKHLYLLSEVPPSDDFGFKMQRVPGKLSLWEITWDGENPLEVASWHIEEPYRSTPYRITHIPRERPRNDICITLHSNYYEEGKLINLMVQEHLAPGTYLDLAGHRFPSQGNSFGIKGLPPGRYFGSLVQAETTVAELEPFEVLPSLSWQLAEDRVLIESKTQAGRVTLPDGRYASFRWKPRLSDEGTPLPCSCQVTIDELTFGFDLKGTCSGVRFINPDSHQVLRELSGLTPDHTKVVLFNHYNDRKFPVRARLASTPAETVSLTELHQLCPAASDNLAIEILPDRRKKDWVPVSQIRIHAKPSIRQFFVDDGFCFIEATGANDVTLLIEEFEPRSGKMVQHSHSVKADRLQQIRLRHPQKFVPIFVRAILKAASAPESREVKNAISPALVNIQSRLRRGVGWSPSKKVQDGTTPSLNREYRDSHSE